MRHKSLLSLGRWRQRFERKPAVINSDQLRITRQKTAARNYASPAANSTIPFLRMFLGAPGLQSPHKDWNVPLFFVNRPVDGKFAALQDVPLGVTVDRLHWSNVGRGGIKGREKTSKRGRRRERELAVKYRERYRISRRPLSTNT